MKRSLSSSIPFLERFRDSWYGSVFRQMVMGREIRREREFVSTQASRAAAQLLSPDALNLFLPQKTEADTFFVLGSGASINRLSDQNFSEIARQRSVGINTWPIHSFVPDFYSFECVSWIGDGLDFARSLELLRQEALLKARPPIVVLRLKTDFEIQQLSALPKEFCDRLFFYGRVTPSTRAVDQLQVDLRYILGASTRKAPTVLADSGSSVVRMVALGMALGYKNIVLTGIDLNGGSYFWQENPMYEKVLSRFPIFSRQLGVRHETLERGRRPFVVTEMVEALAKRYCSSPQTPHQLYVSSEESTLAELIPVYPWDASSEHV